VVPRVSAVGLQRRRPNLKLQRRFEKRTVEAESRTEGDLRFILVDMPASHIES